MGNSWIAVVAAAVTGAFVLFSALLSFISARGEPRRARELRVLGEILKDMPPGAGHSALVERRETLAKKYGESGVELFSELDRLMFLGLALFTMGALMLSAVGGAFAAMLVQLGAIGGATLAVVGAAFLLAGVVAATWRALRIWKSRRSVRRLTKSN